MNRRSLVSELEIEPDFFRIERKSAGDFPFYNGLPIEISGSMWLVVLVSVLVGFGILIAPIGNTTVGGFVAAILFFAVPLAALAVAAGANWTAIFRKIGFRDILLMFGVAILNMIVSIAIVLLVRRLFDMAANPVGGILGEASASQLVLFYLKTAPQLFGEEVVSVLPFLAILWLCHSKLGIGRTGSVIIAWIGAALFFGALHLPTYQWNFVQCFLVIGTARVVLLLGYVITKNIWVSTGAHIINDWVIFTFLAVMLSGVQP